MWCVVCVVVCMCVCMVLERPREIETWRKGQEVREVVRGVEGGRAL